MAEWMLYALLVSVAILIVGLAMIGYYNGAAKADALTHKPGTICPLCNLEAGK